MHKALRTLTMTGLGLLAGATLGMGPAQAAPAAGSTNGTGSTGTGSAAGQQSHRFDDEIVGYYRNPFACEQAGRVGERFGAWSDYDCYRVRWGFRRGAYALTVDRDHWGHGWSNRWHQGTWPGNWPNRPQWPGQGHWVNGAAR